MNRFLKASQEAADETDEIFEPDLKKLITLDQKTFKSLIPKKRDRKRINELIRQVKAATKKNERLAIFKKFARAASKDLLKIVKKIVEV